MSFNAYQIEHGRLRAVLRRFLMSEVESRGTGGCGRVGCGAGAALDSLLAAHLVDARGRCWSCRRRGLGRRPVCMVFQKAHYWLRQPTPWVLAHLAAELDADIPAPPGVADPEATDVLPRIELESGDPATQPLQTPAIPPPPTAPAGWSDLDHGGVGEHPNAPASPWPTRRRPSVLSSAGHPRPAQSGPPGFASSTG